MSSKTPPRPGRGALSNPEGRFESRRVEAIDDGWAEDPEAAELPPLATTVTAEHAKKIITRNDSPDIAFEQSINPYRGCEHGCVYCLWGETQILMADGSAKALSELRIGDEESTINAITGKAGNHHRHTWKAHRSSNTKNAFVECGSYSGFG